MFCQKCLSSCWQQVDGPAWGTLIATSKQTYLLDSPRHMQSLNKFVGHSHVPGVILSSWGCSWRPRRHPVTALSFQKDNNAVDNNAPHQSLIPPVSLSAHNSLPSTCAHCFWFTRISCRQLGMIFHSLLGFKVWLSLFCLCKHICLGVRQGEMTIFFLTGIWNKKELLNSQLNLIILTDEEIGEIK